MKKVSGLSLLLASIGVFLIGLAGVLQYEAFEIEKSTAVVYEKVTVKNFNTANVEKNNNENKLIEEVVLNSELEEINIYTDVSTIPYEPIVYDGLTMNQLADKLNRSLKDTISNKGHLIASYSLEKGVDPYLATAIMLHETGCNSGRCSSLVKSCNNVGGQKGGPSCGGGSYKAYPTLDEGIMGYIDNLHKNYYSYGLNTPEAMASKYAASTTWATKVNNYIYSIKNK